MGNAFPDIFHHLKRNFSSVRIAQSIYAFCLYLLLLIVSIQAYATFSIAESKSATNQPTTVVDYQILKRGWSSSFHEVSEQTRQNSAFKKEKRINVLCAYVKFISSLLSFLHRSSRRQHVITKESREKVNKVYYLAQAYTTCVHILNLAFYYLFKRTRRT